MYIRKIMAFIFVFYLSHYGYCQKEMTSVDSNLIASVLQDSFTLQKSYKLIPHYIKTALNKVNGSRFKFTC